MTPTIRLDRDGWSAGVALLGATLTEWRTPAGDSMLVAPRQGWEDHYVGCVVGRFSRMVRDGLVSIDGTSHQLDRNAGPHHIHGGTDSFSRRTWALVDQAPDMAELELTSAAGDQGYPGRCRARVRYELGQGVLTTTFIASVDRPTLCDVILHPFFTLTGDGTRGHVLDLGVVGKLVQSPDLVPTGAVEDPRSVTLDLDRTPVDDFFVPQRRPWRVMLRGGGRALIVESDQPGVAVYTGDHLPNPRVGVCVQASAWPDAPHVAGAPSAIVRPGSPWRSTTRYTVTFDPAVRSSRQ